MHDQSLEPAAGEAATAWQQLVEMFDDPEVTLVSFARGDAGIVCRASIGGAPFASTAGPMLSTVLARVHRVYTDRRQQRQEADGG